VKTITLVLSNRLLYAREVIESLRLNNTRDYHLFAAIEPGYPETPELVEICEKIDFLPTTISVNKQRFGVNWNNYHVFNKVFEQGSDFNVALEDDTVLSPDALNLADWFFCSPACSHYVLLNFYNFSSDHDYPLSVVEYDSMFPWAWAFTRPMYERWLKPEWMNDSSIWDASVERVMRLNNLVSLRPVLSRSRNIGRCGGTYETPEHWDTWHAGRCSSNRPSSFDLQTYHVATNIVYSGYPEVRTVLPA